MNLVRLKKKHFIEAYKLKHSSQKLILKFWVIIPRATNNFNKLSVATLDTNKRAYLILLSVFVPNFLFGILLRPSWSCKLGFMAVHKNREGESRDVKTWVPSFSNTRYKQLHLSFQVMVAKLRSKISSISTSTLLQLHV